MVNERSLNLDRFERVAESTVDLYGAVRNAYLQRRAAAIRQ
jgi:phospholipid-binding lipoprotein MlaA